MEDTSVMLVKKYKINFQMLSYISDRLSISADIEY